VSLPKTRPQHPWWAGSRAGISMQRVCQLGASPHHALGPGTRRHPSAGLQAHKRAQLMEREPALPVGGSDPAHRPEGEQDPAGPNFEQRQRCCCPPAQPCHESLSPAQPLTPSRAVGDPRHARALKSEKDASPSESKSAFKTPSLTFGSCFLACEMETINTCDERAAFLCRDKGVCSFPRTRLV